jgi:hypothetical protein
MPGQTSSSAVSISDLARLAATFAAELRIDTPIVTSSFGLATPARASVDREPRGEIQVDERFLMLFGADVPACWITIAHEVGHVYWDRRDDLAGAEEGPEWEDGADFTAGQLAARFCQSPIILQAALARVLKAYDGTQASGFHRRIEDRQKVLINGYAIWAEERRFR